MSSDSDPGCLSRVGSGLSWRSDQKPDMTFALGSDPDPVQHQPDPQTWVLKIRKVGYLFNLQLELRKAKLTANLIPIGFTPNLTDWINPKLGLNLILKIDLIYNWF